MRNILFQIFLVSVSLFCNSNKLNSQTFTHPAAGLQSTFTGTCMVNTCSGVYYDNGGNGGSCTNNNATGNYSNNIFGILRTFCPNAPGQAVRVNFPTFCIEGGAGCPYDYFEIINGPTQNSPVLAGGCGTAFQGQTFTSTHPSGCLTFRFYSDNIVNLAGWEANISCVAHPSGSGPSSTSNADCINATGICSNGFSFSGLSTGPGLTSDNCSGCVTSENFSNWYEFTISTSGSLGFTITPTPSTSDYDFALYQASSCNSLGSPVRCSYAATTGNTGLGNGATDTNEDANGNGWVSTINVSAGQRYYLMINEWSPNNGSFVLNWSGTATIQTPLPDFRVGSTTYTNGSTINVCQNNSITINALGAPNSTFTWWSAATGGTQLASGNSFSPSTTTPGSTTYFLQELTSSGCTSARSSITVNVVATPTVTVPNSQTICAGQQSTAITFSGTATTYTWANNNTSIGLGASGTGNIATFTATNSTANPITATISVTPTSGSCTGAAQTFTITVNPSPTVTNPGNQTICAGQNSAAVTFNGTAGATYNWTNDNITTGLGANGTGNIASFVGQNSGTTNNISNITVTPSFGSCLGTAQNFNITVSPPPTINAVTSQTICAGQQTTTVTFSGTATTYSWSNNNTIIGLGASGTGNIAAFTATNTTSNPVTATISITPASGTCQGTPVTFTYTINPSPTVTAPANQSICAGQSTTAITFSGTAGATFNWTNDNTATGLGASGTGNIASFVGTNTTTGPLTSTVTVTPSANGCNGTPATFTITVNITPTMTAPTSQTLCAGQQTTAVTFSGTATTYSWSNNNTIIGLGASGTGNIAAFTATNTTSNPVTATISITPTSGTCQGTPVTFTYTINPSPTVTAPANQSICTGQSTTAITFSGTAGATFNWTNNNTATGLGASGTGNIASFVGTNTTTGPLTSTVTVTPSANGCNGTPANFTITVNITPTMTAPTSQTLCAGQQTTAVTFSGTATTYSWSNNNTIIGLGASGTGNIAAFTVTNTTTSPVISTISVTPTSGTCQGTPTSFTITVNPGVNPTFNPIAPLCQNATAPALPTSSTNNPAVTGTWNPTSISTSTIGTVTYTFTPNANQCANPATISVQILPLVTPTFNPIGPLCQNSGASLPSSSTNTPSITGTWNPTTVSTSTVGITTYSFTPNPNQCAANATMNIEVITNPTVTISTQSICSGQTITIIPTVSPTGGTYLWSNNSSASSITVSPTQTTTYNLLYSLNGCNANSSGIVNVSQNLTPTFTALGPYCQNSVADQLSTNSVNNILGTWNPTTINTSNAGTTTYTFTPNSGICATTATMNVTINPLIQTTFNQIPPLCQFETTPTLPGSSNNNPPINGTWNPATINTNIIGTSTYIFTPNIGQCASNFTMNVNVNAAPTPDAIASLQSGCIPLNVNLQTASIPGATYQWTANGVNIGTTPTLNTTFNASGCYNVMVSVSLGSCSSSAAITNPICAEAPPTVFFTAFPSSFSSSTGNINFSPSNNNLASYSWDFGNGNSSNDISPTHSYTGVNGNITVTLTATSALGCIGNYSLVIPYREQTLFYVPNSFTPDADEFNQTWGPVFTQGFDPYNFQLYIYNRWGELIWESKDAEGRWDGTYGINGLKVPAGVYLWKIEYKPTNTDEKNIVSGHINLLR